MTAPSTKPLPKEIMSLIWEQYILAVVEEKRVYFGSNKMSFNCWHGELSDTELDHPAKNLFCVSKDVKIETERIWSKHFPIKSPLIVKWCNCEGNKTLNKAEQCDWYVRQIPWMQHQITRYAFMPRSAPVWRHLVVEDRADTVQSPN
jgi:hypothetical protein